MIKNQTLKSRWGLIAISILGSYFLLTRVPTLSNVVFPRYGPRVAISHVITALSFLDHGLATYTFQTYGESTAGLHLYSLTGSPWVAILGPVGLRLHSLLLTAFAIIALAVLTRRLYDNSTAILAAALLTASPMFMYLGSAVFPESFHLLFTIVCIYGYAQATKSGVPKRWHALALLSLALATMDHLWGLYILAPIIIDAARRRNWRHIGLYSLVGGVSVSTVLLVHRLTASNRSVIKAYSILYHADYLLSPGWYLDFIYNVLGFAFSPPLGVAVFAVASYYLVRREHVLVASWALTGFAIPFAFPRGAAFHWYYAWGILAPGAILLAVWIRGTACYVSSILWFNRRLSAGRLSQLGAAGALSLLLIAGFIVGSPGLVATSQPGTGKLADGNQFRQLMEENDVAVEDVAIVTELPARNVESPQTEYLHAYLMYSGLYIGGPNSPGIYSSCSGARQVGATLSLDIRDSYVATEGQGPPPQICRRP